MTTHFPKCPAAGRRLATAGLLVATTATLSTFVQAGECPADKIGKNVMNLGVIASQAVTDNELASIALGAEISGLDGRRLRIRRLEVQPGGVVATHTHRGRPALIYVLDGSITEYSSDCAVPIEHRPGDVSRELDGLSHWWRNNGTQVVRLLAADIKNDN